MKAQKKCGRVVHYLEKRHRQTPVTPILNNSPHSMPLDILSPYEKAYDMSASILVYYSGVTKIGDFLLQE